MARKFSELRAKMSPESRARVEERVRVMLAEMPLHKLRRARHFSRQTLAAAMDTTQASVSKLERRVDVYISTLRNYIQAMGGELEIVARFPDGAVKINQFEDIEEPK